MAEIKVRDKIPALIVFIITVAVMIAGLLLPLPKSAFIGGFKFGALPAAQLTGALYSLWILKTPVGAELSSAYSFPIYFGAHRFDLGALMLLIYALVTVIDVVLLFIVIFARKNKNKGIYVAFAGEAISLAVLLIMSALQLIAVQSSAIAVPVEGQTFAGDLNFTVLGGLILVTILTAVQSILYNDKSGVIKLVVAVISMIAAVFTLCDLAAVFYYNFLDGFAGVIKSGKYLLSFGEAEYSGGLAVLGLLVDRSYLYGNGATRTIALFVAIVFSAIVIINLLLDLLGLTKKTEKFMVVGNFIRYIIGTIALLALMTFTLIARGKPGVGLYIVAITYVAQVIIAAVRLVEFKKAAKAEAEKAEAEKAAAEEAEAEEASEELAPAAEVAEPEVPAASGDGRIYNVNTNYSGYNGPIDGFIGKLTTDQKVEFAQVFLERRVGNLKNIPGYIVGGDNSRFFSYVFIYISHVRSLISDGLMYKMYQELANV